MAGGAIGGPRCSRELEVTGERLVHRDRIGLRVYDEALVVRDRPADVRVGPLDRAQRDRVGGHGIRHALALDQPHVLAGGGDDEPVRFDHGDREEIAERRSHEAAPSRTGWTSGSVSGAASKTSPRLSGTVGGPRRLRARRYR